ncbi:MULTISPECIES: hypothetical protein [unclassified Streptomyces]|uniref:hypothetical protein n=1 Tax=unclassified Streptomyces TaxID=2593676 RepID=UPI001F035071|nr:MULTISPECIES: hypothetical protein [unclassified Streptomyces]MCH0566593.1 hypothetical protein [Streptomyces sp. MUM 2J]MCH0572169.1 hypothetical protein [Streptomyces sp. MUM 136J]
MARMFNMAFSRSLTVDDVVAMLGEVVPPGTQLLVQDGDWDVPDEVTGLWARLRDTGDPAWPLALEVLVCPCDLGPYPDLRVAEHIGARLGMDVLCDVDPAVCEVDPSDPYYVLALVGGRWFLASTAGTRFAGPYTDGSREWPGDKAVALIRPVVVRTR